MTLKSNIDAIDFKVGQRYTVDGLTYEVIKVEPGFIECRLNNVVKKFVKTLYCGVYAVMKFGKPYFMSSKIVRAEEEEYVPRKYTKRKK